MAKKNSKNKQIKSKKTNKSNKKEVKPAEKFFKKTDVFGQKLRYRIKEQNDQHHRKKCAHDRVEPRPESA